MTYKKPVEIEHCKKAVKDLKENKKAQLEFRDKEFNFYLPIDRPNEIHVFTETRQQNNPSWRATRKKEPKSRCPKGNANLHKYSFRYLIYETTLKISADDKIIHNGEILPCKYNDGECEGTLTKPFTFVWDANEKCEIRRISGALNGTTTKWNDRFFVKSDPNSARPFDNQKLVKMEIFSLPIRDMCNPKSSITFQPTQYDGVFVKILDGGYNFVTGQPKPMKQNSHVFNMSIDANKGQENLIIHEHYSVQVDFVAQTIFDKLLQVENDLVRQICEVERNQMLLILQFATLDPTLAGYMLTGNRSTFLHVEGPIAWIYTCQKEISSLYISDECYDKIPISYQSDVMYVDPISRDTTQFAQTIECANTPKNLIQLDPRDDNTWYKLVPSPTRTSAPRTLSTRTRSHSILGNLNFNAQDVGLYSAADMKLFWYNMQLTKHSNQALKVFAESNIYQNFRDPSSGNGDHEDYGPFGGFGPNFMMGLTETQYYIDRFISPEFFINSFIAVFGYPAYILQLLGAYFGAFLLIQTIISIVSTTMRTMELHKISKIAGRSASKFKVLTGGIFNVLFAAFLVDSNPTAPTKEKEVEEDKIEKVEEKTYELKEIRDASIVYPPII